MPETVTCFHCQQTGIMEDMYERYCHPNYRQPFPEEENWHCEDCLEEIRKCDFCHSEFHSSQLLGNENLACPECREELIQCSECEEYVQEDETEIFMDGRVCQSCAHDIRKNLTYLHPYAYKPEPIFYSLPSELMKPYYGIELEIDREEEDYNSHIENHAVEIHNQSNGSDLCDYEKYVYIKQDGSLDKGMELVTHPCTYAYHMQKMGWKYILDECDRQGYSSHDIGTCGIHIHISKVAFGSTITKQELNIAKLLLFFETNWSNIKKFSRRNTDSIKKYCDRYGNLSVSEPVEETVKKAKDAKGRYFAVNLQNENTIEIRIFRGTLKIETFKASLQFTHLLTELMPTISLQDTLNLTWNNLIETASEKGYTEFIEYSKVRKIITD